MNAEGRGAEAGGRLGSAPRIIHPLVRFWQKVDRTGRCWEWTGALKENGYGVFSLERGQNVYAHRYAYEIVYGPIPTGLVVRHRCDNRRCVRAAHLILGTTADNQKDMVERGRSLSGERHNMADLTESQVVEMRRLWDQGGHTQQELADRYGTTKANVSQIVRGKRWKHLLPEGWQSPTPRKWSVAR